jgi:hypothetical protein
MNKITKLLLSIAVLALSLASSSAPAAANNSVLFNGVCGTGGANSAVCQDSNNVNNNDPLLGSNGLLLKISAVIASIAGVAAVIVIIIAGLSFITSGGDAAKAQGARKSLLNAVIGVVVIVLSESIIAFVLSKV